MIRVSILIASVAFALAARDADADDAPPCNDEAEAVKKMKKRDPSLRYPKNEEALEHLDNAKRAFGVQEYDVAIKEYTAAGLVDDAPIILYNLGQTYREAKDYEKATRQYKLFLDRGKPGVEVRALVDCFLDTMRAEMEQAASTAPPTGPVTDDPAPSGPPAPQVTPLEPVPTDSETDPETSSSMSRWTSTRRVALGVAGAGVLALGAGIVFGLQSQSLKDDAAERCPSEPCENADEANRLSDRASSRALLANISYGAGAAMVVGAAILWYVGAPSSGSRADQATVAPHITPGFAGLVVGGRF